MKEKKVNGSIVVIAILSILLVLVSGYILYDKLYIANNKVSSSNKSEEEEKIYQQVDIKSDIVKEAMNSFENIEVSEKDIYKNGEYNIFNIEKKQLVKTAISMALSKISENEEELEEYIQCGEGFSGKVISIDFLNSVLSDSILDKKITLIDIDELSEDFGYFYVKSVKNKNGIQLRYATCGDISSSEDSSEVLPDDYVEKNIFKAETEGDYLYIYEKTAFAKYVKFTDEIALVDYYKDYLKTKVLEKNMDSLVYLSPEEIKLSQYPTWDLYSTYKYVFKKVNNKFYFQNIKLYE